MEEEQMIDEIIILFTAGHETTSNALTFTSKLLANNPQYQDLIRQENASIEATDLMARLMEQKITKWVLEEGMRMYPPAYFIDRMNIEQDVFDEKTILKKTPLLFSVIEIHRHKKYWKNPDEFYPERFDGPVNQYSDHYFPFGAGPRMCIGNNFAMFEMQLILEELMKNYQIQSEDIAIEILPLITLRPKNAYLTLRPC